MNLNKKFAVLALILALPLLTTAQRSRSQETNGTTYMNRPQLVVGVVVDQMRYDYLFRYWNHYGNTGFKRLLNEGFLCRNANYNYVPTYTAPGHACIYTGTSPSVNGIISNDWYDRSTRSSVYCVSDTTVNPIGTTSISGKMSPRQLLSTTMTDELRLATNFASKVIGVALKDRGAILPAGHSANAAYWHDPYSNNWVTSSYYMKELPAWVQGFNQRKLVDSLTSTAWTTLLPIAAYTESSSDDNAYEGLYKGEIKPVFPHDLPTLRTADPELIRRTPFGNTYTRLFAEACLTGENMGKGASTDFLAVSFSSTDYVGHQFGINAIETEDTYLRLDQDISEFLSFLDEQYGKNGYLLFLTADHGAANNPDFNHDCRIPSGNFKDDTMSDSLRAEIGKLYGDTDLILSASSHNIYLNRDRIAKKNLNLEEIQERCANFVLKFKGVAEAITSTELALGIAREGLLRIVQNGFNRVRSADVSIQLQPGWIDWYTKTGTTHGAAYSYDTHVPVIFFGAGIKKGNTALPVEITDIAPTICTLLDIEFPSGTSGKPIDPVLK